MVPSELAFADLVEPPRSGFWGEDSRTLSADRLCRVVRNGDVGRDGTICRGALPLRWFSAAEQAKAELTSDDSVLVSSGAYTGNVGRVAGPDDGHPVVLSNFVRLLRPRSDIDSRYLHHLARSHLIQSHVWPHTAGSAIPNLGSSFYRAATVPCAHNNEEQKAIAQVLDTLDTTIRQTEAIIEKLKQVKLGLLHDLLTRGIGANGELRPPQSQAPHLYKNSPLGWIPNEWSVLGLADMASPKRTVLRTGPFGSSLKGEHLTDVGRPVVTIGSLGIGRFIREELLHVSEATARVLADFELIPGDIAFSRVADVGRSVVVGEAERGWIMSSNFMRISVDSSFVEPTFLQAALAFDWRVKRQVRSTVNSAGRDVASSAILMSLRFAISPYDEQQGCILRKGAVEQRIIAEEALLAKTVAERAGLMDDLLTGRVRVTSLLQSEAAP